MDIFLLYMCILHMHALFNVHSAGDKPLGFTELKTGFTMQPLFHSFRLNNFSLRRCSIYDMLFLLFWNTETWIMFCVCVDKLKCF